jgi:hypothetical protein
MPEQGQGSGTSHVAPQHFHTQQALVQWLLEQGPVRFGYSQWSADIAFARELQVTGRIAELARAWGDAMHERGSNVSLGNTSVGVA